MVLRGCAVTVHPRFIFIIMTSAKIIFDAKRNLLVCVDPRVSLASVSIWFRAGSRFDAVGKEGVAHLFEHMLLRGDDVNGADASLREQESRGVVGGAYTNYETSYVFGIGASNDAGIMLRELLRAVQTVVVTPAALRKEKQVVVAEMNEAQQDAMQVVRVLSNQAVWPNSVLGRNLYGTPTSLQKVRVGDLSSFWRDQYQSPMIVCVVPDEGLARQVQKLVKGAKPAPANPTTELNTVLPEIVRERDGDSTAVCVAYRIAPQGDWKSHAVAAVVRDYLANFWSSRLNQELRSNKSHAYWVRGETTHLSDTGVLRILFEADTSLVEQCRKTISREIALLRLGTCDAALLRTCKKMIRLTQQRAWSDPEELMWWYGWPTSLGIEPMTTDAWLEMLQSVTARDVTRFAQTWLQEECRSVALYGAVGKMKK